MMLAKLCLVMAGLWVALQVVWYFIFITIPSKEIKQIEASHRGLGSDILLKKLDSPIIYDPYKFIAVSVLCERKDPKIVPYLIRELKSWSRDRRRAAMLELGKIGDERAIEALVKIAKSKPINYSLSEDIIVPDNIRALEALSKLKYPPAYNYAIEMANSNRYRANGVLMLEYLEDTKAIPLLKKIAQDDPEDYIRHNAQRAIDKIEVAQFQE